MSDQEDAQKMSDQQDECLTYDLIQFIMPLGLPISFVDWMRCVIRKSLSELLAMKHVEYVQYIKDLQDITTIGFNRIASMKLSLALDIE